MAARWASICLALWITGFAVPARPRAGKAIEDVGGEFRLERFSVGVLDPPAERTAVMACEQPVKTAVSGRSRYEACRWGLGARGTAPHNKRSPFDEQGLKEQRD